SVRGSEAAEVAVFLDGVPLNPAGGAVVDLSQLPVDGLVRVEVYRGVPPVELGADAVGGAIHLISRHAGGPPHLRLSAGLGSFGARSTSIGYAGRSGAVHVDANLAYRGATGDFLYYDDQGTLLTTSDDGLSRR